MRRYLWWRCWDRRTHLRLLEVCVAAVAPVARVGVQRAADGSGIGVAFVVMHDAADAPRVDRALDGVPFQGRTLRVTFARRRGAAS